MLDSIVDLSHKNAPVNFQALRASGITAIIHKATQGGGFTDPEYAARKALALSLGFKWGAYHFGTDEDGATQAAHFLATVNPGPDDLLVLDWEANTPELGGIMTLAQAEAFVTYVYNYQQRGIYPGLYGNTPFLRASGADSASVLKQCLGSGVHLGCGAGHSGALADVDHVAIHGVGRS
jgi:lysozyme